MIVRPNYGGGSIMKNQYFGDIRDLFKYDLIQRILMEISPLQKRLTLIPMLTEYDDRKSDRDIQRNLDKAKEYGRPGTNNEKLIGFLKEHGGIDKSKRDFRKIGNYFRSKGIKVLIYPDKGHEYYEHKARDRYFKNIRGEYLHKSLVFADPDNGLEVKNSTKQHLLYSKVRELYDCMDEGSILMIYQQFPREKHIEYLCRRAGELKMKTQTKNLPIYISDNEIVFFLLTKNEGLKSQLERIISRYKKDYPKRPIIENVD
jgi:hypothetical protein